jgi:diguanylate cyclase (GGDEF)-like protein/PAS domain S-box-containing protein
VKDSLATPPVAVPILAMCAALENNPAILTVKDAQGKYVFANKEARRLGGVYVEDVAHLDDWQLVQPDCAAIAETHDKQVLQTRGSIEYIADIALLDGTRFKAKVVKSHIMGSDNLPYVLSSISNLTELALAKQSAQEAERRFELLVESSPYGILLHRRGHILYANSECARLLKFAHQSELVGRSYRDLLVPEYREVFDEVMASVTANNAYFDFLEREFLCQDGCTLTAEVSGRRVPYEGGVATLISLHDISERKHHEQRLQQLANRDALTGLPNRHHIQAEAQRMLERSAQLKEPAALVFIDLDHFKRVNDTHGHVAGDALIRQVAARLTAGLRHADALGRLGGDEFVILLDNTDREACERIVARLLEQLRAPFIIDGIEVYSGASLGVAMFPEAGRTVSELLKAADTAMYHAKADGRFTYKFFAPAMHEQAKHNLWLDTNLRQALLLDQFELFYQPKVDVARGHVVGLEALIRWQHPQRGLISPVEFIPFAEETGLIVPLGRWVIEAACMQIAEWAAKGLRVPVAVNLSARQLKNQDILGTIDRAILRAGIDPSLLEFELTESALIQEDGVALEILTALQARGSVLYLDDFGTGYSSLSQLTKFSLDALKVDKSFVSAMTSDPKAAALVASVVHIAQALNMHLVAEGVETTDQLGMLRDLGCNTVQGYLFAAPLPASCIEDFLMKTRPAG